MHKKRYTGFPRLGQKQPNSFSLAPWNTCSWSPEPPQKATTWRPPCYKEGPCSPKCHVGRGRPQGTKTQTQEWRSHLGSGSSGSNGPKIHHMGQRQMTHACPSQIPNSQNYEQNPTVFAKLRSLPPSKRQVNRSVFKAYWGPSIFSVLRNSSLRTLWFSGASPYLCPRVWDQVGDQSRRPEPPLRAASRPWMRAKRRLSVVGANRYFYCDNLQLLPET